MSYDALVPPIDVEQSLDNLKLERDAIVLYDALAGIEKDPRRAEAFRRIAGNERRHADIWATKLRELGADVPPADGPRMRVRFIILAARIAGTSAVADLVKALEGDEGAAYEDQGASPEVAAIAADEREHAVIWERLQAGEQVTGGAGGAAGGGGAGAGGAGPGGGGGGAAPGPPAPRRCRPWRELASGRRSI